MPRPHLKHHGHGSSAVRLGKLKNRHMLPERRVSQID
jgi:hypothetical protein